MLKGVFLNGATAKVFMATAQNPLGEWFQVNENLAGWRIAEIQPEYAVLEGPGGKLVVPLSINAAR